MAVSERVTKALRSRVVEQRIGAVEALARFSPPESTPLLLEALRDRSHYVAALAARILGEQCDADAVPSMVERFEWMAEDGKARDPGCRIRSELAVAFGKLEDTRAEDALLAGMRTVQVEPDGATLADVATGLRGNCALALAQVRAPGALKAISLLLFDTIPLFDDFEKVAPCKAAAEALGNLGSPAAIVPLALALAYGRSLLFPTAKPENRPAAIADVLASCMDAVVALESEDAVGLLSPFLGAPAEPGVAAGDPYLFATAALALARTRRPEVLPLLVEGLEKAPGEALKPVAIALANLRSDDARAALIRASGHVRAEVRAAAAAALALFPDDEATAVVRRLAERDRDARVRQAAREALG